VTHRAVDLSGADLCLADLRRVNLRAARLQRADLSGADLRKVDLSGADLRHARLHYADLSGADLRDADLRSARLRHADLYGALLPDTLAHPPDTGNFVAWKRVAYNVTLKCLVPATAARTGALCGRKCRAEFVVPLEAHLNNGTVLASGSYESACMGLAKPLTYTIGQVAHPDGYDPDVRVECTQGVHLFLTREECK